MPETSHLVFPSQELGFLPTPLATLLQLRP